MEIQIPNTIFQTSLNDEWETVEHKIEQSKIKRYPYKKWLGISLTKYILNCLEEDLTSYQIMGRVIKEESIKIFCFENPKEIEKLKDNLWTSICARVSEERSRGRK